MTSLREFNSLSATMTPARANRASASSCMRPFESAMVNLLFGTDLHPLPLFAHFPRLIERSRRIAVERDRLDLICALPLLGFVAQRNRANQAVERHRESDRRFGLAEIGDQIVVTRAATHLPAAV